MSGFDVCPRTLRRRSAYGGRQRYCRFIPFSLISDANDAFGSGAGRSAVWQLFGAGEPRDPLGRGGLDVDVCALPRICRCVMSLLLMPG